MSIAKQKASTEQLALKNQMLSAFETFEKTVTDSDTPFLRRLRSSAIARFDELGFPGSKDEEWRFTPLNKLYQHAFTLAKNQSVALTDPFAIPNTIRVVCTDGFFRPELSHLDGLPAGCTILNLNEALTSKAELVENHLTRHATFEDRVFTALGTAFLQDGVFIHLSRECVVEQPIHLIFQESGRGVMAFPRILVLADKHSQATIIETHHSTGEQPDLTIAVSEFVLCVEARIDHYRVNDISTRSFHFLTQQASQCRGSNFRSHAFTHGGELVRNDLFAKLNAENCETTLNGLYTADASRLIDNHTTIDHAFPYCNSHEIYKGIISDKGKGVFNGKIFVRQDAQKTDAKQTNQTLLLSPDATIDTKPQLEIFADDVKCTHGATVGQLDADMLFYLRSRGISVPEAETMLTFAFANELISRVNIPALREGLEQRFLNTSVSE